MAEPSGADGGPPDARDGGGSSDSVDGFDRRGFEARLDELVREHRFTIAVVFPLVGAVTLVASAEGWLPEPLAFNPLFVLFGVLVMRLPLVAGLLPLVGKRAAASLGLLTLYAYGIELVGIRTGWPYGPFEYEVPLGPMLFGEVPVALPVFFFPLVLNAYLLMLLLLGSRARSRAVRLLVTIAAVVAIDLVLDPGAVAVDFWEYAAHPDGVGGYYGVPVSNYLGWVLSATVAVVAFDAAFAREGLLDRLEACEFMLDDMVSFVLLWGGINALYGNWIPVLLAAGFGVGLLATDRFDFAVGDSALVRVVQR
ncbi:bisanhydrobacterioruberin hydratase [Haloarchaeobius sp. FL176]|uniref:bisanhydrobacterioruberin hydratase n=1 Tax=Haloarchaeobius sp. FL176 TaxID=2967129 RepID=UPI002147C0BF|nr:bisanhydrobacterioruberin hydratase [Haloarchaeobius sp. FL176]